MGRAERGQSTGWPTNGFIGPRSAPHPASIKYLDNFSHAPPLLPATRMKKSCKWISSPRMLLGWYFNRWRNEVRIEIRVRQPEQSEPISIPELFKRYCVKMVFFHAYDSTERRTYHGTCFRSNVWQELTQDGSVWTEALDNLISLHKENNSHEAFLTPSEAVRDLFFVLLTPSPVFVKGAFNFDAMWQEIPHYCCFLFLVRRACLVENQRCLAW